MTCISTNITFKFEFILIFFFRFLSTFEFNLFYFLFLASKPKLEIDDLFGDVDSDDSDDIFTPKSFKKSDEPMKIPEKEILSDDDDEFLFSNQKSTLSKDSVKKVNKINTKIPSSKHFSIKKMYIYFFIFVSLGSTRWSINFWQHRSDPEQFGGKISRFAAPPIVFF